MDVPDRAPGGPPPADLGYLNGARLVTLWPDLHLPRAVREAWEERHPVLRTVPVPAAT